MRFAENPHGRVKLLGFVDVHAVGEQPRGQLRVGDGGIAPRAAVVVGFVVADAHAALFDRLLRNDQPERRRDRAAVRRRGIVGRFHFAGGAGGLPCSNSKPSPQSALTVAAFLPPPPHTTPPPSHPAPPTPPFPSPFLT